MRYPAYSLAKRGIWVKDGKIELGNPSARMLVEDCVPRGSLGALWKRISGGFSMRAAEVLFERGQVRMLARESLSDDASAALLCIRPEDLTGVCSKATVNLPSAAEVLRIGFDDPNENVPNYLALVPFGSAVELAVNYGEPLVYCVPEAGAAFTSPHHILQRERIVQLQVSRDGVRMRELAFRPALQPIPKR